MIEDYLGTDVSKTQKARWRPETGNDCMANAILLGQLTIKAYVV